METFSRPMHRCVIDAQEDKSGWKRTKDGSGGGGGEGRGA